MMAAAARSLVAAPGHTKASLPAAKAVRLRGHEVLVCTLSLTSKRAYNTGFAMLQRVHDAFDRSLRVNRWRSVCKWTLVSALRRERSDGLVHVDLQLVVFRDRVGRADNVYAAWRSVVVRNFRQTPGISDAERARWTDVGMDVKVCMDTLPRACDYDEAVRAVREHTAGQPRIVSSELYPPCPLIAQTAADAPAVAQSVHA